MNDLRRHAHDGGVSDDGTAFPEGRVEISGGEKELESWAQGQLIGLEFKGIASAWNFTHGS